MNTPEWEVMIEFFGGPMDGNVLATDADPEFDSHKALWILRGVAGSLDIAARKEERPGNLLSWRVPHQLLAAQANAQNWSEAKRRALMHAHEYHVRRFEEGDGLVLLKAYYQGID